MPRDSKTHRTSRTTQKPINQETVKRLVETICADDDGAHAEELVALLAAAHNDDGAALTAITTALTYTQHFQDCVLSLLTEPAQLLRAVK